MQPDIFDFQLNYFELFGLTPAYALDNSKLEHQYRALLSRVHPDKYMHLSAAEQRVAMQRSTQVNEAYQTLRKPLSRARYLLTLKGVDTQEETNTAMPMDFLMAQMEWREALADVQQSRNLDDLQALEAKLHHNTKQLESQLADQLDVSKNYIAAAEAVRKLRFMEKLAEEIHVIYDMIEES